MDSAGYALEDAPSPWRRRALRTGLSVVVLAIVGLALWPPVVTVQRADAENNTEAAANCGRKLGTLAMAVATGHTVRRELSELEINAHLDRLVGQNQHSQQSQGLTLGLTDLDVDLEAGTATLYVTGRMLIVPLVFEARVTSQALDEQTRNNASSLKLQSLRVGHLPLYGPFKGLVAAQMAGLIAKLPTESTVLGHADTFELTNNQVTILVEGTVEGEMVLPPT